MFEERPWGGYEVLHEEKGFKVKILVVEPGKRLSYQSHKRRKERWTVVMGEATIVLDDREFLLMAGQVVEVEAGQKHRLANRGNEVIKVVEVQLGDYLEEDDIVRYEDDYDRY